MAVFSKVLVANRGEIALRIVRALKEMGIRSVGVYSEADARSLHLGIADEKVCIGPALSSKSYLDMNNILGAARQTGADAIHPGYGYLAENAEFAARCDEAGITFIGPTPENLRLAGDKLAAKERVGRAGVPTVPSSQGGVQTIDQALEVSERIGFPVMIKAAGGGGGRGIRVCQDAAVLREDFFIARGEAAAAFGNGELYVEKLVSRPRHIEFQVLADSSGNIAHLGERECTIQRRFQKLIEESPSPALTMELRTEMGEAAIKAMKAVGYFNAGTVEFLLGGDGRFYFIEINSRIQVEHPVTEMVTGIDLIKEQVRLSAGEDLGYASDDVAARGHAIECRINAEDPENRFMPSPGTVERYSAPGGFGVRLDTHIFQGYELPAFYDSMIAKLIAHGADRGAAIGVMRRALDELEISPIKTTIPLYKKVLEDPAFQAGEFDTGYITRFVPEEFDDEDDDDD